MNTKYPWTHDESVVESVTDYTAVEEARRYEDRMKTIRDIDDENRRLLKLLNLTAGSEVIEIGTGTGAFARLAVKSGLNVTALDVSETMLSVAREKAAAEELNGISFVRSGFLGFTGSDASFDGAVSSLALHHLNDAWKAVALANVRRVLKTGAKLLLVDVVFDCSGPELNQYLEKELTDDLPESMRKSLYGHVAKECSTFTWIMKGLLERCGFAVDEVSRFNRITHLFRCRAE